MQCPVCWHANVETVRYCTQCGGWLTTETPRQRVLAVEGWVHLFSDFLRLVHAPHRTVTQVVDLPLAEIAQVSLVWQDPPRLVILRRGEPQPTKGQPHTGTLLFDSTQQEACLALVAIMRPACPQARFTTGTTLPAPVTPPPILSTASGGQTVPPALEFKGLTGRVQLSGQLLTVQIAGVRGVKTLPLEQVSAVAYAPATVFRRGELTLVLKTSLLLSQERHAILFTRPQMPAALAFKAAVEAGITAPVVTRPAEGTPPPSVADELAKLAHLRDQGVLSEKEFAVQKQRLLAR